MDYLPLILLVLFVLLAFVQWRAWFASRRLKGRPAPQGLPQTQGKQLYYFYSERCPPCRAFAPTLKAFEAEHPGTVSRVDVGRDMALAERFGVRATPTLVVVEEGIIQEVLVGAVSRSRLERLLV